MSLPVSCQRVRSRLLERLDGALPALDVARDAGHLEVCGECAREEAGLARLLVSLRQTCRAEEGSPEELAALHADVLARLPSRSALERVGPLHPPAAALPLRRALPAAAAVLLALIWTRGGFPAPPSLPQRVTLEGWIEGLPAWSELLRGLARLAHPDG